MCPGAFMYENPGDLPISRDGGGSAAADDSGSTTDADAAGSISETTPDYPPHQVVITFAYDMDPVIEDGHGLTDDLLLYVLAKSADRLEEAMDAKSRKSQEEDEDE